MPANASGLADTGALLAVLDRDDTWHARCVGALATLRLPLLTSNAVLTELFHMVGSGRREIGATWRLVRSGALAVGVIDDADLPAVEALMVEYADQPMDFADATLVHLARREQLSTVFTVDIDDFETYRIRGRKRFRIVPGRSP